MFRIMGEFAQGLNSWMRYGAIAIFGSARTEEDAAEYQAVREIAARLAQRGFPIITGGGQASWKPQSRRSLAGAVRRLMYQVALRTVR